MEDIKYKRKKEEKEQPEKSSRNNVEEKSKSNSNGGEDKKYETKVFSIAASGKLYQPCISIAWTIY